MKLTVVVLILFLKRQMLLKSEETLLAVRRIFPRKLPAQYVDVRHFGRCLRPVQYCLSLFSVCCIIGAGFTLNGSIFRELFYSIGDP